MATSLTAGTAKATAYIFKLVKGVRWHPKPPVNGRKLTAEDVKYTYDRFLTVKGNPNRVLLEMVDKVEVLDKLTVKFTLKEPNAWFVERLASISARIVAKECVEKFGDLKTISPSRRISRAAPRSAR